MGQQSIKLGGKEAYFEHLNIHKIFFRNVHFDICGINEKIRFLPIETSD